MKLVAGIFLMAFVGIASGQYSTSAAIKDLAATPVFAFGGIGIAGRTSQGELDFRIIIAQEPKAALSNFERLLATGNPQAKAYAFAGIRKLDPNRFKALLASYRNSREGVVTMEGCTVSHRHLGTVATAIAEGRYDMWINRASARLP